MAANKILNFAPAYVPGAAGNLLNPGTSTGGVGFTSTNPYIIVKHIRLMNKDTNAHVVTLYKGLTAGSAGGTEFAFDAVSIPAKQYVDWYGQARFDSADFLSGIADAASQVTINIEGEIGLV
jgi:hypothetical protein